MFFRPENHGTPRRYNNHQAMPEVGHAKRKKIDCDDLEDFETGENSKRIHSKTTDAPSPM